MGPTRQSARLVMAALMVALATAAPGPVSAAAPASQPASVSELLAARPGLARSVADLPGGAGFLDVLRAAQGGRACECDSIRAIGDVDGDGTQDVVHASLVSTTPYATRLALLDGRTGEPLAQDPVVVQGVAHVVPARLGDGATGYLYLSFDVGAGEFTSLAGAVDGSGTRLWERRWEEIYGPQAGAWASVQLHALALMEENGRTDLVAASTVRAVQHTDDSPFVLERISGADGATTHRDVRLLYPRSVALDAVEGASAPGEVDVLVQVDGPDDAGLTMELLDEVDAEPTWSIRVVPTVFGLFEPELGDVAGDRRPEILLQRYMRPRLLALDGATGKRVWAVDRRLHAVVTEPDGRTHLMFGDDDATDGHVSYRVTRSDPRRGRLWTATVGVSAHTYNTTLGAGFAWAAGDATGDDLGDIGIQVMLWDDDGDRAPLRGSRQFLLDGSSGRILGQGVGYFPLEGSVTAAGVDAIEFVRVGRRVDLLGRDGASGRTLWRTRLGKVRDWPPCDWMPQTLRTEVGPDLVLIEFPSKGGDEEIAFDGGTGEVVWAI